MSLAAHYAAVLKELEPTKVVAYMRSRGHQALLPQVVRILEREKPHRDTVTVAKEADVARMKKEYPNAEIVVDPKVVGGYMALTGTTLLDRTYRRALMNLFYKITE